MSLKNGGLNVEKGKGEKIWEIFYLQKTNSGSTI